MIEGLSSETERVIRRFARRCENYSIDLDNQIQCALITRINTLMDIFEGPETEEKNIKRSQLAISDNYIKGPPNGKND